MAIRCITFDIGGVLLTLGESVYRLEVAKKLGLQQLPDTYQEHMPDLQRGEIDESAVWEEITGRPVDPHEFDDAYLAHFRPIESMIRLAERLRSQGYITALLSNTQPSHARLMREHRTFIFDFDPILFSCEIGHRKPEIEVYRLLLDRLGLEPHEVVFIDDEPVNVAGALNAGLYAIHHRGNAADTERALRHLLEDVNQHAEPF